jgi:hypothetical protein
MKKNDRRPKGLLETIRAITALQGELDQLDSELSSRISEWEATLNSLPLRTRIQLPLEETHVLEPGSEWVSCLTWEKDGGKWKFLIEEGLFDEPGTWRTKPLLDCSREQRGEAVERHIPALLELAVKELQEKIEQRRRALQQSDELLSAVTGKGSRGQ